MKTTSASVVIPAWNEEKMITTTVQAAFTIPEVDEVLVVDDGSTDRTAALAETAGAKVIRQARQSGKGAALTSGAAAAGGEILLFLDADLGASAALAGLLLGPVLAGEADMTIARFPPGQKAGFGLVKYLARWGIRLLTGWLPECPLSGQRAIRRRLLQEITIAAGWGAEVGMTIDAMRLGYRVLEVPVPFSHRATGRDWQGFRHRGRQFCGVALTLLSRLCPGSLFRRTGKVES
ncbi:MAG TPA: glycosyltransferase family 2 protein [Firmicutes bacterium]|nr:glycosyltransferase family 2 protein [Bacillota bacterium]